MSVARLFHWLCDFCPAEQTRAGYGFPKGWGYVSHPALRRLLHFCPDCGKQHNLANEGTTNIQPREVTHDRS